jgi:hypothetical protein
MIERLIQLIHEYQSRVQEAVALFEHYKGLSQPQHPLEWQSSGIPRSGYLDPGEQISYFFHGYGCCVHLPSGIVDWDFGREGQINGFDVWRLDEFVKRGTQNFPEFRDEKVLEDVFAKAKSNGLFHKSDYALYYLK